MGNPTEALLRCPFCGSGPTSTYKTDDHTGLRKYTVFCTGLCGGNTGEKWTEADAIAAWNRRAHPQQPSGWRDIASAPKDGTEIIVFHPEGGVCAAFCPGEGFAWHCMDGMNKVIGQKSGNSIPRMTSFVQPPTHWQPLPPPPSAHPAEQQEGDQQC
ncbi:hypothetical protein CAL26_09830 [Bordetella genomosp. 9]|uniref:DUF551 domain-containing protein n=1 Tax=Bordetella genomosp. 9 TaxID=1416803 RepID=A0A261RFL5_9BORD|nr:Lar family restriction alleviation protein [Bordetella genomosp. 9]OZI23721.1 hypothetical protein CAL26_09830 [Bordetella genomosp. 9]